ncbi:serine/threonine-protein kinase ULK3 [Copidosoma floridanum]|uniref:serine/threonine-protein kinase ULK3 n=1 Tax=Copidosoma floridanum TaxID=29053 RepID=UPI0006C9BA46|nr:serine/threonine-protein kinase ULK3 [Copidosoma floridanum]XP_014209924.1 serine/threonine-protein kinase ULK3 [Copidosoma floridanum]
MSVPTLPSVEGYLLLEKIGAGSFSTVYRAFKRDDKRDIVAIKCVDKTGLSKSTQDNLITEINLLKILKHDHIVEMRDFFWDERHIYIVMEYCNAGDLSSFIKQKSKLAENVCRKFLQQLSLALRYLRNHNVCHMDLKPQNLLLIKTKSVFTLKIADFGLAQFLSSDDTKHSIRGSPLYMAPEILLRHKYDARVDLWSVGVIMYECLFGKAPYSSNTFAELAEKIKDMRPIQLPKGSHISEECKDLLVRLLKHEPNERLTFDEFFAHEFLDLEHAPTKENFDKAVELIYKAVEADQKACHRDAYHLYCESLRYFIPILTNEANLAKKEALRLRINEYIKRAEQLKDASVAVDRRKTTGDEPSTTDTTAKVASPLASSTCNGPDKNVAIDFQELCVLGRSTANMLPALEIGDVAEQYLVEGNYELALEKFKSSLKVLVPLLKKEPPGRRKELLYKQIDKWMKEAESTKAFLITQDMENTAERASESQEQCLIQ